MPAVHIAVYFTKPGGNGNRFVSRIKMRSISQLQPPKTSDSLLSFFCHYFRHRCRSKRKILPCRKRRHIPQMRQQRARNPKMAKKRHGLRAFSLHSITAAFTNISMLCKKSVKLKSYPVIYFIQYDGTISHTILGTYRPFSFSAVG